MRRSLILAAFVLAACRETPGAPTLLEELPRPLSESEQRIVGATSDFAFPLLRTISATQPDENVFISPLSASMALGMTMNGAANETYEAMRTTLGFGSAEEAEINAGYRDLIALLRGLDRHTVFEIANSVWYRNTFTPRPEFLDVTRTWFGAEVAALDFASPQALTTINGWVKARTHGKIETIVNEIPPLTVMYLINAMYFNGTWRNQFDPARTQSAGFHEIDGETRQIPLMHQQAIHAYTETPDLQVVDLPYGNGAFRMTVLLPKAGLDVNAIVADLDRARWEGLLAGLQETELRLWLPKFKLEYERNMIPDLTALGMGIAFCDWPGPGFADFSRIALAELCISMVKQKTFVDVHERGTEAAAVTAVGVSETSMPAIPDVRIDRPFVFALRERLSGTILFVGKIVAVPE